MQNSPGDLIDDSPWYHHTSDQHKVTGNDGGNLR